MPRKPAQFSANNLSGTEKPAGGRRGAALAEPSGNRPRALQHPVAGGALFAFALMSIATIMPAMLLLTWSSLVANATRRGNDATRKCVETFFDVQADLVREMDALDQSGAMRQLGAAFLKSGLINDRRKLAVVINFPNRRAMPGLG